MKFDIITIFPKIFDSYFGEGMIRRAREKEIIKIEAHDLRQWTQDKHKSVDDKPYGGGPGMVMMAEPIYKAVKSVKDNYQIERKKTENQISRKIILFSAKGKRFSQADARRFAKCDQLILICGRYEGVDERVAEHIADEEISIGEFVLTGGEIPAMIMVDAVSRLIPGVLGKEESWAEESFPQEGYAEYPQYTRPEEFMGWKVPDVLLSGDHKKIEEWKKRNAGNN